MQFEHGYRLGFTDVNKVLEYPSVLRGPGSHAPKS